MLECTQIRDEKGCNSPLKQVIIIRFFNAHLALRYRMSNTEIGACLWHTPCVYSLTNQNQSSSRLYIKQLLKHSGQEVPCLVPGSSQGVFSSEKYSSVCKYGMFQLFSILYPCHVLCCLGRRPLHSADHGLGEALQVCQWSYLCTIETSKNPDTDISGINGKLKKNKTRGVEIKLLPRY